MTRNGFTLLELLVALTVFSIAALALLRLNAVAVATAADLGGRQGTTLVAENEVALLTTDPAPPVIGSTSRTVINGGRTFAVLNTTSRTADRRLFRVEIQVRDAATGDRSTLTFVQRAA